MSLSSLRNLFKRRYYKPDQIPSDLPVQSWVIYLDMDLLSGIRYQEAEFVRGDPGSPILGGKVPLSATLQNPLIIMTIHQPGEEKPLIAIYDQATFLQKWGEIPIGTIDEALEWLDKIQNYYELLLESTRNQLEIVNIILKDF